MFKGAENGMNVSDIKGVDNHRTKDALYVWCYTNEIIITMCKDFL